MGREIVYCEACGISLREADFAKGKACEVDNRPYCTACAPFRPAPAAPEPEPSRTKTPLGAAKKFSSTSMPAQTGTPRRAVPAAPKGPPTLLYAGIGAGALLLLILVAAAASGRPKPPPHTEPLPKTFPKSSPTPERPVPPARRAGEEPPSKRPSATQKEPETLKELTEQEKRARFDGFLAQIRSMIASDKEFERRTEIEGMIAAAEKSAGPRLADARALRAQYEGAFDAAAKAAADGARAEADRLWAERKYAEAAERAGKLPGIFKGTRHAEALRMHAEDLAKRGPEQAEKDREAALGEWKVWKVESGQPGLPKVRDTYLGRSGVFETHPPTRDKPASLERTIEVPAGKKTSLSLWVAPHAQGDWELRVLADGKLLHTQAVSPPNSGWKQATVDLTPLAGKKIVLRLENAATDWAWEFGYWSDVVVKSE